MKTLAKKQMKSETASSLLVKALLLVLFCTALFSNANAQNAVFGPILNSNPFNNKIKDVTLFEHDNFNQSFNGGKKAITQNTPNLGNMNNRTTGLAVPLGKKVTLFEHAGYQGRKIILYPGNYSHLYAWNDRATSIKVETIPLDEPVAYFFRDSNNIYTNQVFQGSGAGKTDLDNMVCYDCFSHLLVVGQISVIGYDYANWSQTNNEENPYKEGPYNLADWGFNNAIASYEIISHQYTLSKTVLVKSRLISQDTEQTIAVAATGTNTNVNGAPEMEATVSGCFGASATQSFDAATTVGISTAIRTSVSVGVEGVASASIEHELAAKLETTLTTGNSNTATSQQCWEVKRTIPVPKGCEGKISLLATPEVREWTIEKHYIPVDSNGDPIPGGIPKIVTGKLKVTKGIGSTTNISLNDDCNQGNTSTTSTGNLPKDDDVDTDPTTDTGEDEPKDEDTNTDPTTGTWDDDTSDTNDQQGSSANSTIDDISEIEFCDGEGTVVGFYVDNNGTWEEMDDNGTTRFEYTETKRNNSAIYLSDLNRPGVKIILNIEIREVLYKDNNNPTAFKIYNISDAF